MPRYSREFHVAEVQQTFYQPPLRRTLEKWRAQAPEEFEFTLKAWQLITHESSSPTYRRLRENLTDRQKRETGSFRLNSTVMAAWERTLECARLLRSRVILFQCPPRFASTHENKANVRAFFREIRRATDVAGPGMRVTFVWEPRGEWKPEEIRELCEELNLVHAVDPFALPATTKGLGYFRLHGRGGYRYRYAGQDLEQILDLSHRHKSCYIFFNNISMLEGARRFLKLASKARSEAKERQAQVD